MWTVMWLDKDRGRIDYMTGFKTEEDAKKYVEENGLKTVNDEGKLQETVLKVIEENPKSVCDYRNGKEKAIGFLVGQTMKAMKGKADPGMVNKILKELLSESEK